MDLVDKTKACVHILGVSQLARQVTMEAGSVRVMDPITISLDGRGEALRH